MALLQPDGITQRFGTLTANDAITQELAAGEVLALVGADSRSRAVVVPPILPTSSSRSASSPC